MPDNLDLGMLKELLDTYRGMMFKIAFGILHKKSDAEDVVQDAFLWIINNLNKISEIPCNKRAYYIASIIEHRSLNYIRKQKRHPTDDIDEYPELKSEYSLEKTVSEKITVDNLKQAMKKMSDRDRCLLQLFYFEDKSYQEISKIMGLSKSNVGVALQRAREHLKKILEEEGFSYDL